MSLVSITIEKIKDTTYKCKLTSVTIKKVIFLGGDGKEVAEKPIEGIEIIPSPADALFGLPSENLAPKTLPLNASHIRYLLASDNGKHI